MKFIEITAIIVYDKAMKTTMKALIWHKNGTTELVEKPIPQILDEKDAIVKVTMSSICTSDLHIIAGAVSKAVPETVLGHEFTGEVILTGKEVKNLHPGYRVSVNCETFCGECFFCKKGYVNNCQNGGWLLGCSIDGCQAEYVRVPYADTGLTRLPENVSDENALFAGDILPSGWWSAELCEIEADDTIAIIGAGPVGLCAMQSAKFMGAKRIIAIEPNESRRNLAQKFADYVIDPQNQDVIAQIKALTNNRGADKVIEAAGAGETFKMAWQIARPNAIVAIPAMYEAPQTLPLPDMYGKNLTFKTGGVDANKCAKLIDLISKKQISTDFLISERVNFENIQEGYEIFKNQKDKCLKIAVLY